LYRGGFLAIAATAAFVTAAVARTGSRLGWALDRRPLRWLAARSYSIYLWHWPVAVITRPGIDVHWPGPVVLLVRTAVTLLLADLTHRLVEVPIRTVGFRESVRAGVRRLSRVVVGTAPVGARLASASLVALVLVAAGVLAAGPKATLSAGQEALAEERGGRNLPLGGAHVRQHRPPIQPVSQQHDPRPRVLPPPITPSAGTAPTSTPPSSTPPTSTPTPSHPRTSPVANTHTLPRVSAFGDSVMLGARQALERRFPGGTLDAIEGRQPGPILQDVEDDAAAGRLNPLVVIGVGDNGLIDGIDLRQALRSLRHVPRVVVVNNRVGRPWEAPNNAVIARVVPHFHNARLVDWHRISAAHPDWFYDDGIHLTPEGAAAYARLIAKAART
jgi:hypothetical protein